MGTCANCGAAFADVPGGRARVYCSDRCRVAAHRKAQAGQVVNWRPGDPLPAGAAKAAGGDGDPLEVVTDFVDWLAGRLPTEKYTAKAAIVENAIGQVLVPVDITVDVQAAARRGVIRQLTVPRPTVRVKQRQSLLTPAAVGWGRLEVGTVAADANTLPAASPRELEVWDLLSLCSIGLDELSDTPAAAYQAIVQVLGDAVRQGEDDAFASGSGVEQPFGIAQAVIDGRITQGISAASPPTVANLRALVWDVPAWSRQDGVFLLSSDAAEAVAGLVDTGDGPVWPRPGLPRAVDGGGLFGFDAYELPGLPAMTGTNAPSIIFGSVRAGYRIVDRAQLSIQRLEEQYAEVGKVGLLVRHRVAGDVVRPAAFAAYRL